MGQALIAARALGADTASVGSHCPATPEPGAADVCKRTMVESSAEDIRGAGQAVGAIHAVETVAEVIDATESDDQAARVALGTH